MIPFRSKGGIASKIRAMFSRGEQGLWLDPSDLTTLFQDSAGTTPVTAVEQPVGLILDKSKGLVLGPELVTNGNFSTYDLTGWAGNAGIVVESNELKVTANTINDVAYYTISVTAGKIYKWTWDARLGTATDLKYTVYNASSPGYLIGITSYSAGSNTISILIPAGCTSIRIYPHATGTTGTRYFDNISVKEIQGNHAFQSTSANRPTLSARYNLLTKTEDFSDVVWTKNQTTISTNSATAPNGTVTADRLTAAGTTAYVFQTVYSLTNTPYIISASVLKGTSLTVAIDNGSTAGRGVTFDGATGAFVTFNTLGTGYAVAAYSCVSHPLDANYWLASITVTPNSGTNNVSIWINTAKSSSYAGSAMSTAGDTLTVWGASLVPAGQSSLPYQRVNTATDYDSDQTKFPWYLKFNGTSSSLQTASINFTATDKMFVSAGVRKLSDAAISMLFEFGPNVNSTGGTFSHILPDTASDGSLGLDLHGNGLSGIQRLSTGTSPATFVSATIFDLAGTTFDTERPTKRINGVAGIVLSSAGATNTGGGTYGNYPLYIGARAGTSLFFNGDLYQLVVRGAQATASEIAIAEAYVNAKTKAY